MLGSYNSCTWAAVTLLTVCLSTVRADHNHLRDALSGPKRDVSACGIIAPYNTTTQFTIAETASTNNVTTDLRALLISQWRVAHLNATQGCSPSSSLVVVGNSVVGSFFGHLVPQAAFAYSVIGALMDDISNTGVSGSRVVESCSIDAKPSGQNMGVMIATLDVLPLVESALSAWSNGGCMTTNLSANSTARSWESISLALLMPTPDNTTFQNNSTYLLASSTIGASSLSTLQMSSQSFPTSAILATAIPRQNTAVVQEERTRLVVRSDCSTVQVVSGDSCASLATKCGISGAAFTSYNSASSLCSTLMPGQHVCCSSGTLPSFAPKPQADGTCATYKVVAGDTCSAIAAANSITIARISSWNANSWGFMGCNNLQIGNVICLSSGSPPMPASIANAVCGPQVPGTQKPANISVVGALASLNPCQLNVCCDIWGQCGNTDEFCTISKSVTGAPGTAAPGQNGCISNCGTDIKSSGPPPKVFTVGYFNGYNQQRPCLNLDASKINVAAYTHLNFGFGSITSTYDVSIEDDLTDQWDQFTQLVGPARILSLGGWAFSTDLASYQIFRQGVTAANRHTFAQKVANFVVSSGIDGVDFDWEYPGEQDIPGIPAASTGDGQNYLLFLRVLRSLLPTGKTISLAVSSSYWYLRAFPIADMANVVDYITVMTYDLHGQWDYGNKWSDVNCPGGNCLRSHVNSTETHTALSMITKAGVPSNKIVVGVASYGRAFQMTQSGCTGPMCTYIGPDSGATPGRCTQTPGYIAKAEIDEILSTDGTATTWYDNDSQTDIMVYNSTQWVAYMSYNTRTARTATYLGWNFLGTTEWAIDLWEFSDTETSALAPLPDCYNAANYHTMDDILNDASIPDICVNMYILNVMAETASASITNYQTIMDNGYKGKYNAYARLVRTQAYWAWNDNIWGKQNDWWDCIETVDGKNRTVPCSNTRDGTAYYYVVKDESSFCSDLNDQYSIDCDWITQQTAPYHDPSSGGAACLRFGFCPIDGTLYYPSLDMNFPVLDPSTVITTSLAQYSDYSDWLLDSAALAQAWLFPAMNSDAVDSASIMVFSLQASVQAMQQVSDVGAQAEAEQRKEMILGFITAFLLLIPGIGEAADGVAALAQVARIAKLVDFGASSAFALYGTVEDPESAPMAIAGLFFGGLALRDESVWAKAASTSRSMSQDVIKAMGDGVSDGMAKVKRSCRECSA